MKNLKHILLAIALVAGISVTASAQRDDKKPPKPNPPVVPVEPKKPKDEKPRDDNKGKKPQISFYLSENRIEVNLI